MKKLLVVSMQVGLALWFAGCASAQTFTSARTLDPGRTEVTFAMGATRLEPADYSPPYFAHASLQVRHGLFERVEVGGRLGGKGYLSGNVKFALLRPETAAGGVSLSLAPELALMPPRTSGGGSFDAALGLPLLVGFHLSGGHELTLAPELRSRLSELDLLAGGTVGLALRVSEAFVLTPEVGFLVPVRRPVAGEAVYPTVGVGFSWGR